MYLWGRSCGSGLSWFRVLFLTFKSLTRLSHQDVLQSDTSPSPQGAPPPASERARSVSCYTLRRTVAMVLLELDPFLNELTKLYENTKKSGTVWVTLKRSTLQRQKKRKTVEETPAPVPEPSEYRCLVRATDGKKKISCSLNAKDHLRFQTSYGTVLKAHMDSLKKKEKKDKKEKRTTAAKAPAS